MGTEADLSAIIGEAEGDGGIPHGDLLAAFAEAVVGEGDRDLADVRATLLATLGPAQLVDAAGVAATFNAIDRVADSTGIPIDEERLEPTAEFREELGINAFPSRQQAE